MRKAASIGRDKRGAAPIEYALGVTAAVVILITVWGRVGNNPDPRQEAPSVRNA